MTKSLRKTMKKRKSIKKIRGGDCTACDKDKQGYFAGGGNRRQRKSRKSMKSRKSRKSRSKTGRKVRGGAFQGYSMWTNAGPLESSGVGLTKSVLNAQQYLTGNPMVQPIEFKYGDHNTPKV